jgi:malonyl CoA-acyl carrier protein transacylase
MVKRLNQSRHSFTSYLLCFSAMQKYLQRIGIQPIAVGGHSLGELTAFCTVGAYDEKNPNMSGCHTGKSHVYVRG